MIYTGKRLLSSHACMVWKADICRWISEYRGLAYFDFCDIMKSIMLKESHMTHQETPDMAVSGVSAY